MPVAASLGRVDELRCHLWLHYTTNPAKVPLQAQYTGPRFQNPGPEAPEIAKRADCCD